MARPEISPAERFRHTLQHVFNTPLLVTPSRADMIALALANHIGLATPERFFAFDDYDRNVANGGRREHVGYEVIDGIAIVPVCGTLVQKLGGVDPWSGMLGYDCIRTNLAFALEDEDVEGILLDIDSPGGEVAGCFDLCDQIYGARGVKPIRASVNELSCSAGYAIGSCAEHISIARTGIAGSIGVVYMHVDFSAWLDKEGIKVTFVQAGKRKTDGASELPLSNEAYEGALRRCNAVWDIFAGQVARNRGLSVKAVKDQEADIFQGEAAIAAGLADDVMPINEAFAAFRNSLNT